MNDLLKNKFKILKSVLPVKYHIAIEDLAASVQKEFVFSYETHQKKWIDLLCGEELYFTDRDTQKNYKAKVEQVESLELGTDRIVLSLSEYKKMVN